MLGPTPAAINNYVHNCAASPSALRHDAHTVHTSSALVSCRASVGSVAGVDRNVVLRTHLRRAPPILTRSAYVDETLGCQAALAPEGGREEIGYSAPGGRGVCVSSSSITLTNYSTIRSQLAVFTLNSTYSTRNSYSV